MRIKKNEEKKLEEKVKKDQKEVERRAEITKQRRKFDSTYVFSKTPCEKSSTTVKHNDGQPPLHEINQISTLFTTVTGALETLINKHKMTDIGNQNLLKTSEVKEDIKKEVNSYANIFNAAKNLLDKVETANKFLSHMEEVEENENSWGEITENSLGDVFYSPAQLKNSDDTGNKNSVGDSSNDIFENPIASTSSIVDFNKLKPKKYRCVKCKKIFVVYNEDDKNEMKKRLMQCNNVDKLLINKHFRKYQL